MNLSALISTFGADFNMTPLQWNLMLYNDFLSGVIPCYLEALEKPIGVLFSMPCKSINYDGPDIRKW